jgi:hypothetical protein
MARYEESPRKTSKLNSTCLKLTFLNSISSKIGRFKPDCVAEYMRKVYDGDNDQSHPGYKMDKRFKAYLANSVKKEFDKTDFKIHFKNL